MDTDYQPAIETEVVVSMYKEPIAEVSNMLSLLKDMPHLREAKIHIYVKDSEADTSKIIEQTGANNVTILPNIGRESETYLSHILLNWDNLARSTIFLQADVHNPREFYPRVRDFYIPETGMLSLGWSGQVCDCNDCGDKWSFHDSTAFMPELHGLVSPSTATCDNVLLTYKGQFAVSAKRIRGVDRAVYEYLQNLFADENSWAHQEPFLDGREDSLNAPVLGYVMERAWNVLFQCSDMDVAWKCPTLLSGSRIGGSVADCQCLDAP
ncbi:hypothetical protein BS50DRAFT_603501 [Corynespora cassiicola Philippines]|uniref:Glycosyltransferase 2-like domain-containing protein n=1 Tax=Corynespora cassiicola Philippines TaxID=1448308 RepID=A0A2T2NCC9_CORCC|nr:hypothetical protein BS50DRAFT_603501 [Corynespora cassiicola Philippines]